ncbi:MAG TPA: cell wall-binding repeat-containing protein [Solirubrobacteraceae bacterium]|nr:cell wall-binding repeat-containing protein [Solirubrobacteraceae bacterium]
MPPATRQLAALGAAGALALALAACGQGASTGTPAAGVQTAAGTTSGSGRDAVAAGYPALATKNTTRVSTADPVGTAAAVARIVFPDPAPAQRPRAVALADAGDWRGALAGAVLMAPPLRAPLLYTANGDIPAETSQTLAALAPTGAPSAAGAQAIRLGTAAAPGGLRTVSIPGSDPYTLAANIDAYRARVAGSESRAVVVVSAQDPAYAMPAAAWAAKSGDPVLFTARDSLPQPTRAALAAHGRPRIYVLGPSSAVSSAVASALSRLGTVTRIAASTPQASAIAFARFVDGTFGWRIVDPGHGLVFASPARAGDAGAAAPLSASGTYGPLLLTDARGGLPASVASYLLDIKPGYSSDPVRGVYNHGWIVGDPDAVSVDTQASIDSLLEIAPVKP